VWGAPSLERWVCSKAGQGGHRCHVHCSNLSPPPTISLCWSAAAMQSHMSTAPTSPPLPLCWSAAPGLAAAQSSELQALAAATRAPLAERSSVVPPPLPPAPLVAVPEGEVLGALCCPGEEVLAGRFRAERAALLEVGFGGWREVCRGCKSVGLSVWVWQEGPYKLTCCAQPVAELARQRWWMRGARCISGWCHVPRCTAPHIWLPQPCCLACTPANVPRSLPKTSPSHPMLFCCRAPVQRGEDPAGVFALLAPNGAAAAAPTAPPSARSSHSGSLASYAASDDGQQAAAMDATPGAAAAAGAAPGGGGSERVDAENVAPPSPAGSLASVASEKGATGGGKAGAAAAAVQPAVGVTTRRGARSRIPTFAAAGGGLTDRTNME
jgi:hypothetical protein